MGYGDLALNNKAAIWFNNFYILVGVSITALALQKLSSFTRHIDEAELLGLLRTVEPSAELIYAIKGVRPEPESAPTPELRPGLEALTEKDLEAGDSAVETEEPRSTGATALASSANGGAHSTPNHVALTRRDGATTEADDQRCNTSDGNAPGAAETSQVRSESFGGDFGAGESTRSDGNLRSSTNNGESNSNHNRDLDNSNSGRSNNYNDKDIPSNGNDDLCRVSRSDFVLHMLQLAGKLDRDRDLMEWVTRFHELDLDGDGFLTMRDVHAFQRLQEVAQHHADAAGSRKGVRGVGGGLGGQPRAQRKRSVLERVAAETREVLLETLKLTNVGSDAAADAAEVDDVSASAGGGQFATNAARAGAFGGVETSGEGTSSGGDGGVHNYGLQRQNSTDHHSILPLHAAPLPVVPVVSPLHAKAVRRQTAPHLQQQLPYLGQIKQRVHQSQQQQQQQQLSRSGAGSRPTSRRFSLSRLTMSSRVSEEEGVEVEGAQTGAADDTGRKRVASLRRAAKDTQDASGSCRPGGSACTPPNGQQQQQTLEMKKGFDLWPSAEPDSDPDPETVVLSNGKGSAAVGRVPFQHQKRASSFL